MLRSSAMDAMQNCFGNCDQVPPEVCDAVLETLTLVRGGNRELNASNARATAIAQRMAVEGWRFCSCFARRRTPQHGRICQFVQTDLANVLANRAVLREYRQGSVARAGLGTQRDPKAAILCKDLRAGSP